MYKSDNGINGQAYDILPCCGRRIVKVNIYVHVQLQKRTSFFHSVELQGFINCQRKGFGNVPLYTGYTRVAMKSN